MPSRKRPQHGEKGALAHGARWLQQITAHEWKAPYPPPPADWRGDLPEWAIYWAATAKLGLEEGPDFRVQTPLGGGRNAFGGQVLDFVFDPAQIVVRVQGEYVHYELGQAKIALDQEGRVAIAESTYQSVDIDAEDAVKNPVGFLKDALLGIDRSKGARF